VTAELYLDVAPVKHGPSPHHALALSERIDHEAACPVVALLSSADQGYVRQAALRMRRSLMPWSLMDSRRPAPPPSTWWEADGPARPAR